MKKQHVHDQAAAGDELIELLLAATRDAERCGFHLPAKSAIDMTTVLLRTAADAVDTIETFDVVVGEDGSIEVTVVPGSRLVTFDISQSGAKLEMVVRDVSTGEQVASNRAATVADFVKWIGI